MFKTWSPKIRLTQMKNYVYKNLKKNDFNIDVGCMQINIKWHKNNFKKISDMFEVNPNVSYAASFLKQLKSKHLSKATDVRE